MTVFYEICYATDEELEKAKFLGDIKGEVVGAVASQGQAQIVIRELGSAFFYRRVETQEPSELIQRVRSILKQVETMKRLRKPREYDGVV